MILLTQEEPEPPKPTLCHECHNMGYFWTEWSNAADDDPEQAKYVLEYPDPPDGTVCVACPHCEYGQDQLEMAAELMGNDVDGI